MRLLRPVRILEHDNQYCSAGDSYSYSHRSINNGNGRTTSKRFETQLQISTGLTFDDGDQLLVSAQKPLGILLEERGGEDSDNASDGINGIHRDMGCIVSAIVEGGAADKAGVKEGDFLVAVQNVDVGNASFEEVMERISDAPRVVNLRFWRRERY